MRNKQSESHLQSECVRWFRYQYPEYRVLLFAIPNGGKRNISTAKRLKAEGVVPGVADLFLAVANLVDKELFHGLWIEMKSGKNKQTEFQKDFAYSVIQQGYRYQVCYSFDEFKKCIEKYLQE